MRWFPQVGLVMCSVVAACGYDVERQGRVVDAETSIGIVGIRVHCTPEVGDTDTTTGVEGRFSLYYDEPCETLEIIDIDGATNAAYEPMTIPFPDGTGEIVVQLTRVP